MRFAVGLCLFCVHAKVQDLFLTAKATSADSVASRRRAPPAPAPPTPAPAGDRFVVVDMANAVPEGNYIMPGSLAACEASCTGDCLQYAWNRKSLHCYTSSSQTWAPLASDHIQSGCLPDQVSGCPGHTPTPAAPTPAAPTPPAPTPPAPTPPAPTPPAPTPPAPTPPAPTPPPPTPPAPPSPACVITKTITNMTGTRMNPGGFTFNDTVYFAGGEVCADVNCTKFTDISSVESYNPVTETWTLSSESLPAARTGLQCVSLKTAVVCAGPPTYYVWHGPGTAWETVKQSIYRIEMGYTAVDGRWAVFAGGEAQPDSHSKAAGTRIDVFDSLSNKWSTGLSLSNARKKLACGSGGDGDDTVVCAGGFDASGHKGYMNTVDVFNLTSMSKMSVKASLGAKRMFLGAGGAGHKVVVAGGLGDKDKTTQYVVDVLDTSTMTMHAKSTQLGAHRYFETSATVMNRWVFFGPGMGGKSPVATLAIDMYDTKTDYMYQGGVNPALPMMSAMNANGAAAGACSFWANGGARSRNYHTVANTVEMYCVSGC